MHFDSHCVGFKMLLPLVIGIILALIIEPTVSFLERKTDYDRGVITA